MASEQWLSLLAAFENAVKKERCNMKETAKNIIVTYIGETVCGSPSTYYVVHHGPTYPDNPIEYHDWARGCRRAYEKADRQLFRLEIEISTRKIVNISKVDFTMAGCDDYFDKIMLVHDSQDDFLYVKRGDVVPDSFINEYWIKLDCELQRLQDIRSTF